MRNRSLDSLCTERQEGALLACLVCLHLLFGETISAAIAVVGIVFAPALSVVPRHGPKGHADRQRHLLQAP